jgi:hypothetical protein
VTAAASVTGTAETSTGEPSVSCRLPSTRSSHSSAPAGEPAGASAAMAAVSRRPRSSTGSHGFRPRATSTSACSGRGRDARPGPSGAGPLSG